MMGWDGWDHMNGWGWFGMTTGALLLLALVVGGFVLLSRVGPAQQSYPPPSAPSPEEVLAERLARGEITPEDYRQRLTALGGTRGGPTSTT